MLSLTDTILKSVSAFADATPKTNYTDVRTALVSYRDYFRNLLAERAPAPVDLRPRADALVDHLNESLGDYESRLAARPGYGDYAVAFKLALRFVNKYNTKRREMLPALAERVAALPREAVPAADPTAPAPTASEQTYKPTLPAKAPVTAPRRFSRSVFPPKRSLHEVAARAKASVPRQREVYPLRISLVGSEPEIWRRYLVPATTELADLHRLIQRAMDWNGEKLHRFKIGYDYFGPAGPDDNMDRRELYDGKTLADVFADNYNKLTYTYDFAAGWDHLVQIEPAQPFDESVAYPVCTGGERAAPPDDAGGIKRYNYLVEAFHDPRSEDHELAREILGPGWEADLFVPGA